MPLRSFCLAALAAVAEADCSSTCRRSQPCWPSSEEVRALHDALDPHAARSLHWGGDGLPFPAPVPAGSEGDQPLFGSNDNLEPLYEQLPNASWDCLIDAAYCRQATRNKPLRDEQPAFVAWPLNADHVQKLVRFARAHNLGVSVAGTGHDFLNRHTCDQGIMIRMSLMKDIDWRLNGTDGGSVRLGAGLNFAEVMHSGAAQRPPSYTVAGWGGTVGVVGWALGGGHGPFGRSKGNGAENLLELEVVTADGEPVTASPGTHPDLFWALRGGGGSAWGVVTAVTFKAYASPPEGLALASVDVFGDACEEGLQGLDAVVHGWANWTAELGSRWSGILDVIGTANDDQVQCGGNWSTSVIYAFEGAADEVELAAEVARLIAGFGADTPGRDVHWGVFQSVTPQGHWWDYLRTKPHSVDYIWTSPFAAEDVTFASPYGSIAVAGGKGEVMASKLVSTVRTSFSLHASLRFNVFHDIPGQVCPVRPAPNSTSLGPFSDAQFHLMTGEKMNQLNEGWWHELGSGAYFGESAYIMEDWKQRYWGGHYDELLKVKRQYDPTNFFWCHNCVGSDLPRTNSVLV